MATEDQILTADLKAKWLAALRGEEYEQGTGCLASQDGKFCCLGVLARVAGIPVKKLMGKDTMAHVSHSLDRSLGDENRVRLENMNDGHERTRKRSFPEIADWIEANIL